MHVEKVPPEGKVKYLEQMITLVDQETTEIQHRIWCAWSAFAKHRQELTSQSYLLRHGLHVFNAVVTPATKYGKNAPHYTAQTASTHHLDEKFIKKNLEKKTFVTTKQARVLTKKTAHMMNTTKTAVFHPFFPLDPIGPSAPLRSCCPSRETLLQCFFQHFSVTSVMLKQIRQATLWQTAPLPRRVHRPLAMARPPWSPHKLSCLRGRQVVVGSVLVLPRVHFFVGFCFRWLLDPCPKANAPTSLAACDCGAWSV